MSEVEELIEQYVLAESETTRLSAMNALAALQPTPTYMGVDFGFAKGPTIISVIDDSGLIRCHSTSPPHTAAFVAGCIAAAEADYGPRLIACDSTGLGMPIIEHLRQYQITLPIIPAIMSARMPGTSRVLGDWIRLVLAASPHPDEAKNSIGLAYYAKYRDTGHI